MRLQQTVQPMEYKVAESFISINGEGIRSGELALFIRFTQCNLRCSYCDTMWANSKDSPYKLMSKEDILNLIRDSDVDNVTITGGEPLLQRGITDLLNYISQKCDKTIEIETNGSIDIKEVKDLKNPPLLTMDYKLPSSGMEEKMLLNNLHLLNRDDTVKFVVGSYKDLLKAKEIIEGFRLQGNTNIYISPVFNKIEPEDIVTFMKDNRLNRVKLQVQLHKIIWHPDAVGV